MRIPGTTRQLERRLGDWARSRLPGWLTGFVMFGLKQGWACLFGGLMLGGLIVSSAIWRDDWALHRYDALLVYALALQALFLVLRLESPGEARVILLFHLTGTAMEVFKVAAGSWAYPEPGLAKVWGVPLFSGFMYASVGSYMARAIRIFEMRFAPYPPWWTTLLLAAAIYANFFAHHFILDFRLLLFAATVVVFGRTRVWFRVGARDYWMPMVLAGLLTAFFLWVAENVGTATNTWVYPGQGFDLVSLQKMGSWYLLIFVSFVTVTLVNREALSRTPVTEPVRARPTRPDRR